MVVEKSVKELENSKIALTITVDAASIEKAYQERLKKYAANLQVDGFRKGKVPASIVERKYGDAIREESTFECMENTLQEVLKDVEEDKKPLPYSTPVLQDEDKLLPFKKDTDITFTVHYEVMPKFELPAYTGLTVEVKTKTVTDDDVNAEIEKLREQNSLVVAKDGEAAKDDIATVDYVELDEDGEEIEESKRKDFTFTIGSGYNLYKIDDDVIGMKTGDEKTVEKELDEKNVKLSIKLTALKKRELPEVDDEFAEDVKDEYKSVADLKNGIKKDLESKAEEGNKNAKAEAIIEKLVEESTISVPESMVEFQLEQNWKNFIQNSGLPEEQLMAFFKMQNQTKESIMAEWREPAVKDLKGQLILEEIKKKENFELDQAEFDKECDEKLKNIEDEATKDYYKNMLKDEKQFAMVIPFLLEKNTFTEAKEN